ncbi:MAG: diguanylate cyclase [Burkholderiales bacterium]|nr:diguanylate cyclase [Burkholderiales bacterium]
MNTEATQTDQTGVSPVTPLRDEGTGLLRANAFVEQLDARLQDCAEHDQTIALLKLSFGGLGVLNETLGDHVTEALIIQIAGILRPLESEGWLLGRMANDRFLIASFACSDKGDAMAAMGDLLQRFNAPIFVDGMELHLSSRAGAALFPLHGDNAQRLMLSARQALTRSLATEHNGVLLYTEELGLQAQRETRLTVDLRSAISRKQMYLTYEPQIDLRTGEVVAVDAVVVWNHPEYGVIDQTQIMTLADQTAQIIAIGEWIVSQAVSEIQKVQRLCAGTA